MMQLLIEKEKEEILTAMRQECIKKNLEPININIFSLFAKKIQNNFHLVISMGPERAYFKERMRKFPFLI